MGLGGRAKMFQEHMYLSVLFNFLNILIIFKVLLGMKRCFCVGVVRDFFSNPKVYSQNQMCTLNEKILKGTWNFK